MYDILRLYVYHDGVRVGMAESADSLQWMPAFDDLGEFKLVCAATETNRALLVLDAVLYNPDTPGLAAVVLAAEADGDNHRMTVRGKFSLCLFKRRTARGSRTITDGAAGLLEVCRTNLRGLAVAVPPAAGFTAPCEETVAWADCASAAVQLMQAGGFGGRVRFDPATAAQTLELLQGKDRSVPGTALYNGYFSTRMQNLSGAVYTQDASDYANVVLCGGEEPGENDSFTRYFCELGDMTASGKRAYTAARMQSQRPSWRRRCWKQLCKLNRRRKMRRQMLPRPGRMQRPRLLPKKRQRRPAMMRRLRHRRPRTAPMRPMGVQMTLRTAPRPPGTALPPLRKAARRRGWLRRALKKVRMPLRGARRQLMRRPGKALLALLRQRKAGRLPVKAKREPRTAPTPRRPVQRRRARALLLPLHRPRPPRLP